MHNLFNLNAYRQAGHPPPRWASPPEPSRGFVGVQWEGENWHVTYLGILISVFSFCSFVGVAPLRRVWIQTIHRRHSQFSLSFRSCRGQIVPWPHRYQRPPWSDREEHLNHEKSRAFILKKTWSSSSYWFNLYQFVNCFPWLLSLICVVKQGLQRCTWSHRSSIIVDIHSSIRGLWLHKMTFTSFPEVKSTWQCKMQHMYRVLYSM